MPVLVFLKDLIFATFGQMASLLGGVFIFGLLIHFISGLTFRSLERSLGRAGVYLVAWLGTPVHELGHAIFCLIFMHRIVEVAFFKPDPATGSLGYVYHKWNRRNPWAVLGNFFIGIGPVILGCLVLFGLFRLFIPESGSAWDTISAGVAGVEAQSVGSYLSIIRDSSLAMVSLIFTAENLGNWQFWVFCYLSVCVASNIRLSLSDIKGALSGLGCVVLPFLLLNLVGLLTGFGGEQLLPFTASSLGAAYSLLILAFIMVVLGFAVIYLLAAGWTLLVRRRLLNPF